MILATICAGCGADFDVDFLPECKGRNPGEPDQQEECTPASCRACGTPVDRADLAKRLEDRAARMWEAHWDTYDKALARMHGGMRL